MISTALTTFALFQGGAGGWGLVEILIAIVLVAACVAVVIVALRYFGITIPPVVIYIFWIVVVAAVAILAIRFLAGL